MVYFIQGEQTNLVKIGKADDVLVRLQMLQCGSPDRLVILKVDVASLSDRPYHEQFAEDRVHGEWFRASANLTTFLAALPASKFDGLTHVTQYEVVVSGKGPAQCLKWRWSGKVRHAEPCTCESPLEAAACRNYTAGR